VFPASSRAHRQTNYLAPGRSLELPRKADYIITMDTSQPDIRLSASAAAQITRILDNETDGSMLRVSVQGGGCSGFQYSFSIDDTRIEDDLAIERDGVTVLIDAMSQSFLAGAEIDWVDDLIGASFQIKNPNATASCGCGTSFSV